jgi:hypothetical protein
MRPDDLALATINTGEFYETHKKLAKNGAPLAAWVRHVKKVALPAYRKSTHEPDAHLTHQEAVRHAIELRDYYTQHVKEL